jgi:ATP-dependent RNA helicase DeaD
MTTLLENPMTLADSSPSENRESDRSSQSPVALASVAQVDQDSPTLFRDLPLSDDVQLAVQMAGYVVPTAVQTEIIPHMLEGRDVLAQSQTGTGKTAAFALPILSRVDLKGAQPQVLVLAPTRELATQVAKSFETYGACMPRLRVAAIYGGADYEPQLRSLKRGVHIVVGTPGRVIDHIRRGTLKLDSITCLVLDEADEMLNMGFIEDVEFVLEQSHKDRQIALFSATMPEPIRRIADKYLVDPITITVRRKTLTADSIQQRCVFVDERNKAELLVRMLESEETDGVLVFTKTKESTVQVAEHLTRLGISAAALNGDLPQSRRQRTVDQLKSGQLNVVVATDVAARGLDVQRISHVFNYDLPHDSESYIHRIGRTGRAGRTGIAIIFLTPRQRSKLHLIEKTTKQRIEVVDPPRVRDINLRRIEKFKNQISHTLETQDLGLFKKLVEEYTAQTGKPVELVAAAVASMAQGKQPLLLSEMPNHEDPRRSRGSRDEGRRESFDGRDSGRPTRAVAAPKYGMQRFRLEVGKADGVRVGNIVGAIANEVGIPGSEIGPIEIRGSFSTVDLPAGLPSDVLQILERTWVSGKQLRIKAVVAERSEFGSERSEIPKPGKHRKFTGHSAASKPSAAQGSKPRKGKPFKSGAKSRKPN